MPRKEYSPIPTPETRNMLRGAELINLSGQPIEQLYNWFPEELQAEKIIALPDIAPGRSPLPTGACVEIDTRKVPEWRKYAVSDVGCGMQVLSSQIHWEEFDKQRSKWDQVGQRLKDNAGKLGDLGSGNHFVDAAIDDDYKVYFVIHTGSRDQSRSVEPLTTQPESFDQKFAEVTHWALQNRSVIAKMLEQHFGPLNTLLDAPHNFYEVSNDTVTIYKGAAKVEPYQTHIIPSNLDSPMALVQSTPAVADLKGALSHGTGRAMNRSQSKAYAETYDFDYLRKKVYIPPYISNASLRSELPVGYRELDHTLQHLDHFITVQKLLTPVAYLGQL